MTFTTIDHLIDKNSWNLLCWRPRYGSGVWVALGPVVHHLNEIESISTGADIEALELDSYFHNEGSWLPVVLASDLSEGLAKLEEKIKSKAAMDTWQRGVWEAFECIIEENDGNYGLKIAVERGEKRLYSPGSIS